jgi:hypothetical protein
MSFPPFRNRPRRVYAEGADISMDIERDIEWNSREGSSGLPSMKASGYMNTVELDTAESGPLAMIDES